METKDGYRRYGIWRDRLLNSPKILLELPSLRRLEAWWSHPWNVHPYWFGAIKRGIKKV